MNISQNKFVNTNVEYLKRKYTEEYILYKKYHISTWNCLIHAVTVYLEWLVTLNVLHTIYLARPFAMIFVLFQLVLVKPMSFFVSVALVFSVYFVESITMEIFATETVEFYISILVFLIVHLNCWMLQVGIGHFMIDKNRPSMAEGLSVYGVIYSLLLSWETAYEKCCEREHKM